jgi:hypothetical protein
MIVNREEILGKVGTIRGLYFVAPSILGELAIVQVRTWNMDTKT